MKKLTIQKLYKPSQKLLSYAGKFACVAFLFLSQNSFAAKTNFLEENRSDLKQIEDYLNKITTLTAKFTQKTSGSSNKVTGKFYLARPGKMRVEYLAEPKILITVNDSSLSYYDVELDEISELSTNTTPASFLTRANISFDAKDVEVTDFKKTANEIKISVMKKNRKEAGEFSLIFKRNPFEFSRMEVKNDLDQIVTVTLSNIDFESPIPSSMFILKNKSNN
jgi:outer membrane lipoprotein-sorting protein